MEVKSYKNMRQTLSLLLKIAIVLFGIYGLVFKSGLLTTGFDQTFFHYFTNISNLAVVIYFIADIIWLLRGEKQQLLPFLKQMMTFGIVVTFVVVM